MSNVDIIYDHYKDTYSIQKENEKTRNKLFIILCLCILLLMLMIIYPDNIYTNIQEFFLEKIGININFELVLLDSFNWFIILYLTVRYYQINANIEKNYKYIHRIEDTLERKFKLHIYREGKNYLEQYPIFLQFSYIFYKYLFPCLFSGCILIKVIYNITNKLNTPFLVISIISCLCILVLNASYFIFNYQLRNGEKKDGKTKNMC